jgi:acyl-CoA thioesterase II
LSARDFKELLAILDLSREDDDLFIGSHPSKNPIRTFGGQMMAQAFVAASRSLKFDVPPSAMSVHFIAGGDPEKDLEFRVARLRDERRFANRRVDVMQDGQVLTTAMVAFLAGGQGLEHNVEPPVLTEPESLLSVDDRLQGYEDVVPHFVEAMRPIDWRYTNDPTWVMRDKGERLEHNRVWMRTVARMPDDPVLHTAAMIYSSDTTVLDSIITTHGLSWGYDRIFAVTTNHSVWFHRPVRFDEWVLYSTSSPVAADSRGLGTGHFFGRSGEVLATVIQEGIVKYFPGKAR